MFDNDCRLPQNRGYAVDHVRRLRRPREIDAGERLAARLEKEGIRPLVLREPGGTAIGEAIRYLLQHSDENHGMTPETELLLFEASRSQLVWEKIQPALVRGEWVICDRFFDSTTVYQGAARDLDPEAGQ